MPVKHVFEVHKKKRYAWSVNQRLLAQQMYGKHIDPRKAIFTRRQSHDDPLYQCLEWFIWCLWKYEEVCGTEKTRRVAQKCHAFSQLERLISGALKSLGIFMRFDDRTEASIQIGSWAMQNIPISDVWGHSDPWMDVTRKTLYMVYIFDN